MFGLFKKQKLPSAERKQFDNTITLLLSGFDDQIRGRAKALVDLDGLFTHLQRDGSSPVEAGIHATALILSAFIDHMPNAQRELHRKAFEEQDWSDPFCKMLNYLAQVAEQFENQGHASPALVRMLTFHTIDRLRGLSTNEAQNAWGQHESEFVLKRLRSESA
jgi:hypothetical protein